MAGNKIYYTRIQRPGQLGIWTEGPQLPEFSLFHAAAASNGFLYVLGGEHYNGRLQISNKVYVSRINSDGSPGAWQNAAPLPQPLFLHNAAVWGGMIYVTGGWSSKGLSNQVYSASIQADGSLGPWSALSSLPEAVYTHATVQDGTLYILGGVIHQGLDIQSEVYYALIQPDKTLASWQTTTPLTDPLSNHAAAVAGGRVYVLGGWTGQTATNAVHSAAILSNKALGDWEISTSLPAPLYMHAATVANDVLYVSGGSDGTRSRNEVYAMPLETKLVATIDFNPNTLNLLSRGRVVTCYIEFPAFAAKAADIDPASVVIVSVNNAPVQPLSALARPTEVEDGNGAADLMVKFDRSEFAQRLGLGDNRVGIEGRLRNGKIFTGADTVWAISPSARKAIVRALLQPALHSGAQFAMGLLNSKGGRVFNESRSGVDIPEGATGGGLITVNPETPDADEQKRRESATKAKGLIETGPGAEFGPDGTRFDKPVTLELAYDPQSLKSREHEDTLQVHYWNSAKGEWEALGSQVDKTAHAVRAQTSHFSLYKVFAGGEPAVSDPASAPLSFGEIYVFPNPARAGAKPVIHVEVGKADQVIIKIYNVAGQQVHEASIDRAAQIIGSEYAYEHAWEGHIPSGVYFYVVEAKKSGYASIRRTGKLAVVR
ncbi:MAG: T9SS type A sorting domain-containing protein [Elusimicrobia bacterium]|nr:T9SS type A sorting domain-containing protein [Elusimicrobiota bacterium]